MLPPPWDYLVLTASSEAQAASYQRQLELRLQLGLLRGVRQTLALADPGGQRVGSGGSTLHGLLTILNRELGPRDQGVPSAARCAEIFGRLRVLMIHAGGGSWRLPAYSACGKAFVPVPVPGDGAAASTLFDIQWPIFRRLPPASPGAGQVVIAAGDVDLEFRPEQVAFDSPGITGLGCKASPAQASRHGVYCLGPAGQVRRFLQKPTVAQQHEAGAVDGYDQAVLDIGVIQFDAPVAAILLGLCGLRSEESGRLSWSGPVAEGVLRHGLDFYREICCALGRDCTWESYRTALQAGGSKWDADLAARFFQALAAVPVQAQVLTECTFLHFGTSHELIPSGQALLHRDRRTTPGRRCVTVNSLVADGLHLPSVNSWTEGCSVRGPVEFAGDNLLVGVDVDQPLSLPAQACLDVVPGRDRIGRSVSFVRCYHEGDLLQDPTDSPALCGYPLSVWLERAGAQPEELWQGAASADRSVWNARLFPAEIESDGYRRWLWMLSPEAASAEQFQSWRQADRYSLQELAACVDEPRFNARRAQLHETRLLDSLRRGFLPASGFSAADLAHLLAQTSVPQRWLAGLVAEARWQWQRRGTVAADETFIFSRIVHSLGTALLKWDQTEPAVARTVLRQLPEFLPPPDAQWLEATGLNPGLEASIPEWASRLHRAAFDDLRSRILSSGTPSPDPPVNALRSDEIVWSRAPARLDLAGGWTDTPPFALEQGGRVLNAAVELNDQPPIHVYARVVPDLLIRFRSIDTGTQQDVRSWDDLLDYTEPTAAFALPKAALAISGLAPRDGGVPHRSLAETLQAFGGGLELTTLAAIPKGSGLGTSSIMGAVLLATIQRVFGRQLSQQELFHAVLRLEQVMTTGGGWQDQIGGAVGGVKLATTQAGLVPDASLRYVLPDALDPQRNGGQTLLYYTGITRLAKNILQEVVGRWLDRDRDAVETLQELGLLAGDMTEALARKDVAEFGQLIDRAWQLNKRLDPNSTTGEIDAILADLQPHLYGAKLLGAGGGGFLFLVCRSAAAAGHVRRQLLSNPPNSRARFFDYRLSEQGLAISVC